MPSGTEQPSPPPVRACLFDMDGLLINTEDLYTHVTNIVLHENGRPSLPWRIKAQLQGRPYPAAGKIFHEWAKLPISHEQYHARVAELQREWFPSCAPLPGALELLGTLTDSGTKSKSGGPTHIALATSSTSTNYTLKTNHLPQLTGYFSPDSIIKGDDKRIPPGRGKPAPDIYLLALRTINERLAAQSPDVAPIKPEECLVFEDSVPGVEAGRRAGMQVVWVPHLELLAEYKGREEEVLAGLTGEHKEDASAQDEEAAVLVGEAEGQEGSVKRRKTGAPGELGDGWGVLLKSLEDFPYEKFGIIAAK
jgi:pseudouridine 5'-phosphatase